MSLVVCNTSNDVANVLSLRSFPYDTPRTFARVPADWIENAEAHVFKVDLPGVPMDQVKVEVQLGRFLEIRGSLKWERDDKEEKWHRIERRSGRYVRRFSLPEDAKTEEAKASMKNGVLTVNIPKKAMKDAPAVKVIEISDE